MIRPDVGRVIAMVCRENQKIILPQFFQKQTQISVEFFNLSSISLHISAMPPKRIKIHQIDKAESPEILSGNRNGLLHSMDRTVRVVGLCDSLPTENVIDLSHADHIIPGVLQGIQNGRAGRL